ncbi:hypothetical protein [Candidatus Magnetominusculus dajiuhuensis]|uniref:hypothetical protein n=1 Tax=Candidatus Magnetominusculus dajiuhuensis TaxID=3137712 RepID=UPI003B431747
MTDEERDAILISMNENIKGMKQGLVDVKQEQTEMRHELSTKPDRDEVRFMLKQEIEPIKKDLSQKPDRDEVRRIVTEEVEAALSGYRFMKVK